MDRSDNNNNNRRGIDLNRPGVKNSSNINTQPEERVVKISSSEIVQVIDGVSYERISDYCMDWVLKVSRDEDFFATIGNISEFDRLDIPQQIINSVTIEPEIKIAPENQPANNLTKSPNSYVRGMHNIRKSLVSSLSGDVLLYCATPQDVETASNNNRITNCTYLCVDKFHNPIEEPVISEPRFSQLQHLDLIKPYSMDYVVLNFSVSYYCANLSIFEAFIRQITTVLKPSGEIYFFSPVTTAQSAKSKLLALCADKEPDEFVKVIASATEGNSYTDYAIPAETVFRTAHKYDFHAAPMPSATWNIPEDIDQSVTIWRLRQINLEQSYNMFEVHQDQLPLAVATVNPERYYTTDLEEVIDRDLKREISFEIEAHGCFGPTSAVPLEYHNTHGLYSGRFLLGEKHDGINLQIIHSKTHNTTFARYRNGRLFRINPIPELDTVADGEYIPKLKKVIFFDAKYKGGILDRLAELRTKGPLLTQRFWIANSLNLKKIMYDGCNREGIILIDAASPYRKVGNDKIYSPAKYWKIRHTMDVTHDTLMRSLRTEVKLGIKTEKEMWDTLVEMDEICEKHQCTVIEYEPYKKIIRPRPDKDEEHETQFEAICKLYEGRHGYVSYDGLILLLKANEYWEESLNRGRTGVKLFKVSELFPGAESLPDIINEPANLDKLAATYPHPIEWRGATPREFVNLYKLRAARFNTMPASNSLLAHLLDIAQQVNQDWKSNAKKRALPRLDTTDYLKPFVDYSKLTGEFVKDVKYKEQNIDQLEKIIETIKIDEITDAVNKSWADALGKLMSPATSDNSNDK